MIQTRLAWSAAAAAKLAMDRLSRDNLNILPLIRPCPDWRRRAKVPGCGAAGPVARGDAEPIRAGR
jgi:hypothetical protein